MSIRTQRTRRRADALSKARIVEAAIEILDGDGEDALTVRALAGRLATGRGAISWHVADKDDLLAAAADEVVARVMAGVVGRAEPREAIRAIALGLFDAIDEHPWVGAQLFREPWRSAVLRIVESVGGQLPGLGGPERALVDAWSALVNYYARRRGPERRQRPPPRARETDRSAFPASVAARWAQLDPAAYPFVRQGATRRREHDDREQLLAGLDLILAGIATLP